MGQKNSQTHNFEIKNFKEVYDFCYLNQIMDVNSFIDECFKQGFDIKKYGLLGKTGIVGEKQVEIEVIREIRVEVPVEVIKEVEVIREVIKEVPVETIKEVEVIKYVDREVIVEVPVPIIDKIGDETQVNELLLKIQQLENRPPEIVEIIKEVQVIKEVSVEKVVEVEKSNDKMTMLQETLQTLRKELNSKTDEIKQLKEINKQLESIKLSQGAVYMKGSNLNENL